VRLREGRLRRFLRLVRLSYAHFEVDEGWTLAGYIAFASLLAIFPFVIFAMSLASATVGPDEVQAMIDMLFEIAPENIASAIEPVLREVLSHGRGVLTLAGVGAIWASSNGVEAFRVSFDRAYGVVQPRSMIMNRLVGLGFVVGGAITFLLLGFVVVLAPLFIGVIRETVGVAVPYGLGLARYAIGISAFALFLWSLHAILPSRPTRKLTLWPGILATIVLWTAGAMAFSAYLSYAPSYTVTYGGLSGAIVTLLFFYLTGAVMIFGAELNATYNRDAEGGTGKGERAWR
jgi:membrane protein